MKNKRTLIILAIALIVCISAALIILRMPNENKDTSGIIANASQSPAAMPTPEQSTTTTPEPPKKIIIKLGIWPESTLTDEIKLHEGYVAKMKEKYPNVEIVPSYYKYTVDSFKTYSQAGMLPTIFEAWLWSYQSQKDFIASLSDITDEFASRGWDKALNPGLKDMLSKDGKTYGIPRDGYALGLMMNVGLFEQAGLVDAKGYPLYPKTMDELAETAKKIKDATGKAGICILAKDYAAAWQFSQIAWNFGAPLVIPNTNSTYTANLDSDGAIAAMNFIKDLKWKYDVLTDNPIDEDWNTGFAALGKGNAAMYIAASDAVNQPTQVNGLPLDKLAMCGFPAGPGGDAYSMFGGTVYAFAKNATPDEINACLDYLEIMGKAPVATEDMIAAMKEDAKKKSTAGIPVIPRFPCWINKDYLDAEGAVINEFANVDASMFKPYFDAVMGSTHKLCFEDGSSSVYQELLTVLQAVVTDKNTDVESLMKTADSKLQQILDQQFPK